MTFETIRKSGPGDPPPNMADYDTVRADFTYDEARAALGIGADGAFNLARAALDRHVAAGRGNRLALRWCARDGRIVDHSYADLAALSSRVAHALERLGIDRGERVFGLSARIPELYGAALGTLKRGAVFSPLFAQFGPEPILARMTIGDAAALVTTEALYKRKVAAIRDQVESLRHVILIGPVKDRPEGVHVLSELIEDADPTFPGAETTVDDMALVHFTSGTTGRPKGVIHVHEAALHHYVTARYALDLHPDDVYWCTADPGWVTGTSYGILAPLLHGVTLIVDEAEFDAERWYGILQDQKVTVWYTAPTAIRMLMRLGGEIAKGFDLGALRHMASVGEPLNPEAVVWGQEVFGKPFHDNWWQTETGGIMVANYPCMDVKPGSMGRPMPGVEAAILHRLDSGGVAPVTTPGESGELALRVGWPSMMRGYLHEEARYRKAFAGDWYLSGDLATRDAEGYFWFVGRADDVIKTAGHLIGPFEVESALLEHEAVAEAGVIGVPDDVAGEIVKAFVALKPGFEPCEDLQKTLQGHARKKLGPAVAPREIAFRQNLPKTRSGKIMRRLLKARELGLEEGDLSTLESDEK